jgi:phosphoribosyl 1,2-cyclic phosphodiesterase
MLGTAVQDTVFGVRFWGTRGSIPSPGARTVRYGGNTPCTEVRCGEEIFIFDAGTGIRELGESLLAEFGSSPIRIHLFIGHTHWDHIQGFPFFGPAFKPDNEITVYGHRKELKRILTHQMEPSVFPIGLAAMNAGVRVVVLQEPVQIGPCRIDFERLNHPGGAVAYRVQKNGKSLVYMSDHENYTRLFGAGKGDAEDRRVEAFARDSDLLICEAQYTEEEYMTRKGWGHSTFQDAVQLALHSRARRLAIFHHDPSHDDDFLDQAVGDCRASIRESGSMMSCFGACEGQTLSF